MEGGILMSVKDVQVLLGFETYDAARKYHKTVRDALNKKSKHISILEFCKYEEFDFDYVWNFLRGKKDRKSEK